MRKYVYEVTLDENVWYFLSSVQVNFTKYSGWLYRSNELMEVWATIFWSKVIVEVGCLHRNNTRSIKGVQCTKLCLPSWLLFPVVIESCLEILLRCSFQYVSVCSVNLANESLITEIKRILKWEKNEWGILSFSHYFLITFFSSSRFETLEH